MMTLAPNLFMKRVPISTVRTLITLLCTNLTDLTKTFTLVSKISQERPSKITSTIVRAACSTNYNTSTNGMKAVTMNFHLREILLVIVKAVMKKTESLSNREN